MSDVFDPYVERRLRDAPADAAQPAVVDPYVERRLSQQAQQQPGGTGADAEARRRGYEPVGTYNDGTIYKAPDGSMQFISPGYTTSDPDAIKNMMENRRPSEDKIGVAEGAGRAALQGLSFGTGDEVVAGLASVLGEGDYDQYLARERDKMQSFRSQNPYVAYPAEIAGAIPTALAAPVNTARGASLLTNMLRGGAVAGAEGGVYGYAQGEGGVLPRLESGAQSAAISAPVGVAAIPAAKGIGGLFNQAMTRRAAKEAGMPRAAYNVLQNTAKADRVNPAAITDDMMLADTGKNAASILDTATQRSGQAGNIATDALEARVNNATTRLNSAMDEALGTPQGVRTTARGIADSTRANRTATYDTAFSQPIDYASAEGRKIEEVVSRIPPKVMREAVEEANADMMAEGARNLQIVASVADDGTVTFSQPLNVQQADAIKRSLQAMGRENIDQFGRATSAGRRAKRLGNELRAALGDAVPEYNAAVQAGADKIGMDNALDLGYSALRESTTREAVAEAVEGMSDAERAMAAQGIRSQIDDTLANVKRTMTDPNTDAREAAKAIKDLTTRASREKIATIIGDEKAARLMDEIDVAARAFDLRSAVADNSKTFARTSTDEMIRKQVEEGAWNALRMGEPLGTGKQLWRSLTGRSASEIENLNDATFGALVDALMRTGPAARGTAEQLQRGAMRTGPTVERANALSQALLRRSAPVAVPAAGPIRQPVRR